MIRVGLISAVGLLCVGCAPVSHAVDAPPDVLVVPRIDAPATDCGTAVTERDVAVLFVVQSYGLTIGPRNTAAAAAEALPRVLRGATSGTIRFAALTADAGPGGIIGNGCDVVGRDGVILSGLGRGDDASAPIISLPPGASVEPFVADALAILDDAFNDGCVNQVLESTLRAITPTTVPVSLPAHGSVHGDTDNRGLVEPGDILLVVLVTDAEDCSWNERVTDTLPDGIVPCPTNDRCCSEVLYPAVERYVPAFRSAADALGVDLAFALLSGVPEADVSLAEWRRRGAPELCAPRTPEIYANMPWRILEALDYFEPFVTTQPRCDPNYQAIADVVSTLACATAG